MWYVGAFQFRATPRQDKNVSPEDLEKALWEEIEKVKQDGVTSEEIQKVQNQVEARFIRSLSSTAGLARTLGRAALHRGWRTVLTDLDAVKAVTSDDIKAAASKYFVKDNSLTAIYKREMSRQGRQPRRKR